MATLPDSASTRDWYNKLSGVYDRLADASERPARVRGMMQLNPQPGETLLEIGFGTGQGILAMAHAVGSTGFVHGIDLSDGMRDVALARVQADHVDSWVALEVGDARTLPYAPGMFDGVFMSFTLELFSPQDIAQVLSEVRRVLRPQGRLAVVSLSKQEPAGVGSRVYEKLHSWFPRYIDCHPIDLQPSLEKAEFRITHSERFSMWGIPGEVVCAKPC